MKQNTGKKVWTGTGQVRTVWYDPENFQFWFQKYNFETKKKQMFRANSMQELEYKVKFNGWKFL